MHAFGQYTADSPRQVRTELAEVPVWAIAPEAQAAPWQDNWSIEEKLALDTALREAKRYLVAALACPVEHPLWRKVFGDVEPNHIRKTQKWLARFLRTIDDAKYRKGKRGAPVTATAHYLSGVVKLHPKFWRQSLRARAVVLIHEIAHLKAWAKDRFFISVAARDYRTDRVPGRKLIKNADSLALFCLEAKEAGF